MKKNFGLLVAIALIASILCLLLVFPAFAADVRVILDGEALRFDVPILMANDGLLVPLRAIFEAMGAEVVYDGSTQTVIATKGDTVVVLIIGDESPTINGQIVPIDQPGFITDGRTMAPLRFVAEAFGGSAVYDPISQIAAIWTSEPTADSITGSWKYVHSTEGDEETALVLRELELSPPRLEIGEDGALTAFFYESRREGAITHRSPYAYDITYSVVEAEGYQYHPDVSDLLAYDPISKLLRYTFNDADVYHYFQRMDSPDVAPPASVKNVTVSTPQELVDAIAPYTCITIKSGVYDLSTVARTKSYYASVGGSIPVSVSGVDGLTLQAESGADVELVTPDMFAEVLRFAYCSDITLKGIKAGHTVTGEYECDAGVVLFNETTNILIEDCLFYGCGSIGIDLTSCSSALISDTTVTDCSLRAVDLWLSNDIVFSHCKFIDNRAYGCVIYGNHAQAAFIDCEISGNKRLLWSLVDLDGETLFERCVFRDNGLIEGSEPVFKGSGISLRDCEIEQNNFNEYWDDDVIDLGGNLFK